MVYTNIIHLILIKTQKCNCVVKKSLCQNNLNKHLIQPHQTLNDLMKTLENLFERKIMYVVYSYSPNNIIRALNNGDGGVARLCHN